VNEWASEWVIILEKNILAYLMVLSQDRIENLRKLPQMSYEVRMYSRQYSNKPLLQYKSVVIYRWLYEELNNVNNYTGSVFNLL
jgi:hypothetical protein